MIIYIFIHIFVLLFINLLIYLFIYYTSGQTLLKTDLLTKRREQMENTISLLNIVL